MDFKKTEARKEIQKLVKQVESTVVEDENTNVFVVQKFYSENRLLFRIIFNLIVWFVFSIIYSLLIIYDVWDVKIDEENENYTLLEKVQNGVYLSTVVHTSIGLSDYHPRTRIGQTVVMTHAILAFVTIAIF